MWSVGDKNGTIGLVSSSSLDCNALEHSIRFFKTAILHCPAPVTVKGWSKSVFCALAMPRTVFRACTSVGWLRHRMAEPITRAPPHRSLQGAGAGPV